MERNVPVLSAGVRGVPSDKIFREFEDIINEVVIDKTFKDEFAQAMWGFMIKTLEEMADPQWPITFEGVKYLKNTCMHKKTAPDTYYRLKNLFIDARKEQDSIKKKQVSGRKRGRPKGSKNKPKDQRKPKRIMPFSYTVLEHDDLEPQEFDLMDYREDGIARSAAMHYHEHFDGWYLDWPLTFKVWANNKGVRTPIGTYKIDREFRPVFDAKRLGP